MSSETRDIIIIGTVMPLIRQKPKKVLHYHPSYLARIQSDKRQGVCTRTWKCRGSWSRNSSVDPLMPLWMGEIFWIGDTVHLYLPVLIFLATLFLTTHHSYPHEIHCLSALLSTNLAAALCYTEGTVIYMELYCCLAKGFNSTSELWMSVGSFPLLIHPV